MSEGLVLPAYDYCLKCSHTFNILDARGAISVTERTHYIGRVRALARRVAEAYLKQREEMGYPLLQESAVRTAATRRDSPWPALERMNARLSATASRF